MNLWNVKNIEPPSTNTCKIDARTIDLKRYVSTFKEADEVFSNQIHLEAEAALLSRTIYRLKQKFRSDKGLKEMQKMNTALLRYLHIDLPKIVGDFRQLLPDKRSRETYYPTLNMLDYLLVRTQGAAKLMCRTADCAQTAAFYMEGRISIGHLWKVAFIAMAIAARIFVLAKELVNACCSMYNQLLDLRSKLRNPAGMWISEGYIFPNKLETWLGEDWSELQKCSDKDVPLDYNTKLMRFSHVDDSDIEYEGEYIEIETDVEMTNEYVDLCDNGDTNKHKTNTKGVKNCIQLIDKTCNNTVGIDSIDIQSDEDIGEVIVDAIKSAVDTKSKIATRNGNKKICEVKNNSMMIESKDNTCKVMPNNFKSSKFKTKKHITPSIENLDEAIHIPIKTKNIVLDDEDSDEVKHFAINSSKRHTTQNEDEIKANTFKRRTKDIGLRKQSNPKKNKKATSLADSIKRIDSIADLKGFVTVEQKQRNINGKDCKLKHMNKMQWNMLHNVVMRFISKTKKVKDQSKIQSYLEKGKSALLMNVN